VLDFIQEGSDQI